MLGSNACMEQGEQEAAAGGTVGAHQPNPLGVAAGRARASRLFAGIGLTIGIFMAPSAARATSAKLDFSVLTLSFPSADPDTVPTILAVENPVIVTVDINGPSSTLSELTVMAAGDLMSGSDQIPVSQVEWQAQGVGFVPGPTRLSKDAPQLVGQWAGNTNAQGSLRFGMENSWDYATGVYSQTVVYTLIAY